MDNTMNNGYYYGGYQQPYTQQYYNAPYGYQPVVAQNFQVPQNMNALTDEEIRTLMNDKPASKIDLNIKQTDVLRAMCTHKQNGQDRVQPLNDGSGDVWCPICGARWSQEAFTKEQVTELVNALVSSMQNAKWLGDLPVELTRELFTMIPLLEKYPDIYEYAMNNFNKYYNQHNVANAQDASIYAQYNSLFGNKYYQPAYPTYQYQPQGAQQTQAGYYYQGQPQQQGAVNNGYYQPPVANPYNNPMQATYGVNYAAPNQQFVQQTANMVAPPQGAYQQQQAQATQAAQPAPAQQATVMPTYAPAAPVNAAPQGYQPAASAIDPPAVKNNGDGTATSENKVNL
jgi:hypothetical protein